MSRDAEVGKLQMPKKLPVVRIALKPLHPERVCWGCDKYCRADDLACGNGSERTPHPIELFGDDWQEWAASLRLSDAPDPSKDPE